MKRPRCQHLGVRWVPVWRTGFRQHVLLSSRDRWLVFSTWSGSAAYAAASYSSVDYSRFPGRRGCVTALALVAGLDSKVWCRHTLSHDDVERGSWSTLRTCSCTTSEWLKGFRFRFGTSVHANHPFCKTHLPVRLEARTLDCV